MKIVICDDCVEDLQYIEQLLGQYTEAAPGADFVVEKYLDAAVLYDRIQEGEQAEIYILDMIMAKRTGIDLGSLIRKVGGDSVIICSQDRKSVV